MNAKWIHPADLICMVMQRIYDRGLTTLTGGNLSVMDDEGVMWVSPTNVDKGSLTRDDIVRVYPDGHFEGKHRPSSEYRIHHRILKEHPNFRAVLHAHPPALVTMSVLHEVPDTKLTVAAYEAAGEVGLAEYGMPGTLKLVECVGDVFNCGYSAAVLKNHATFLASQVDLFDAFRRFEQFNSTAELQLNAGTLGCLKSLTKPQIDAYEASVKKYAEAKFSVRSEAELALRRDLTVIARRAYAKGLFTGMFGSVSARTDGNNFIINPRCSDNACLSESDFVRVEDGKCERGKTPDDTAEVHQAIYRNNPDVNSVIVAAPVCAASFAVCDRAFDVTIIPESYGVLRNSVRIPFEALVKDKESIGRTMSLEHPLGIIDHLGIVLAGPSPLYAFDKLEVAEFTAVSIHQAIRSGKEIKSMTKEQLEEADSQ